MDNTGAAAGDDQGSGWFEVKKKHKSSSKFSIQNWVGGFSKQQANGKGVVSNDKHRSHISRSGKDFIQRGGATHSCSSKEKEREKEKDEPCHDKRVIDDDGHLKAPPLKNITTTSSNLTSTSNDNVSEKKPGVVNKIKWGDLEDDDLSQDCSNSSVSGIRFGKIGDDDLAMCGTSSNNLGASGASQDDSIVNKDVAEATSDTCHKSSSPIEGSLEENGKDVGEVASNCIVVDAECNDQDHKKLVNNDIE